MLITQSLMGIYNIYVYTVHIYIYIYNIYLYIQYIYIVYVYTSQSGQTKLAHIGMRDI